MSDCSEMLVFGATLGAEADMLIKRSSAENIAMGAVMQAAAAAYIEEYCDEIQSELNEKFSARGKPWSAAFCSQGMAWAGSLATPMPRR